MSEVANKYVKLEVQLKFSIYQVREDLYDLRRGIS